jgi:hypothetical protein
MTAAFGVAITVLLLGAVGDARSAPASPFARGFNEPEILGFFEEAGEAYETADEARALSLAQDAFEELRPFTKIVRVVYAQSFLETLASGEAGSDCAAIVPSRVVAALEFQGGMQIGSEIVSSIQKAARDEGIGAVLECGAALACVEDYQAHGAADALAASIRLECRDPSVVNVVDGMSAALSLR